MNRLVLALIMLSMLQISARMVAQDSEVYELRAKLKYAEDFAKLHPNPGNLLILKYSLNNKLAGLKLITSPQNGRGISGFGSDGFSNSIFKSGGFGSGVNPNEKPEEKAEREASSRALYEEELNAIEKKLADLEKFSEQEILFKFAQANLAQVKDEYDKALKKYFEFNEDQ